MLKSKLSILTALAMAAALLIFGIKSFGDDKKNLPRGPWSNGVKRLSDDERAELIDKLGKGANEKIVLDIFCDSFFVDTEDTEEHTHCEMSKYFSADEKKALGATGVIAKYKKRGECTIRGIQLYTCYPKGHKNYVENGPGIKKIIFDCSYYAVGTSGRIWRRGQGFSYGIFAKDAVVNISIETRYRSKVSLISKRFKDLKVVNNDKPGSTTLFLDPGEYKIKVYNGKIAK